MLPTWIVFSAILVTIQTTNSQLTFAPRSYETPEEVADSYDEPISEIYNNYHQPQQIDNYETSPPVYQDCLVQPEKYIGGTDEIYGPEGKVAAANADASPHHHHHGHFHSHVHSHEKIKYIQSAVAPFIPNLHNINVNTNLHGHGAGYANGYSPQYAYPPPGGLHNINVHTNVQSGGPLPHLYNGGGIAPYPPQIEHGGHGAQLFESTVNNRVLVSPVEEKVSVHSHSHSHSQSKNAENEEAQNFPFIPEITNKRLQQTNDHDDSKLVGQPYLFQVPEQRSDYYPIEYKRLARSIASSNLRLNNILQEERKVVDTLKRNAEHDEDLMMISYIGQSIIDDLEARRSHTRAKRATSRSLPLRRILTDRKVKLDIPKTIDNIGTVTRNVFEDRRSPMFHVRNLVGSAKNTMLAAMRIPPQNLLVPSKYGILKMQGNSNPMDENVGAINPDIFSRFRGADANVGQEASSSDPFGIYGTFQKVGAVLRDSVRSGQDTMIHMGDMANDARNVLHTARYTLPKVILPYAKVPHVSRKPTVKTSNKLVVIAPRIFDISDNSPKKDDAGTDYVKLGHILDAVGVSRPNSGDPKLEKVIFEKSPLPAIRRQDLGDYKDAMSSLENAKSTVGAKNLKDFLVKMKNEFADVLEEQYKKRKEKNLARRNPNTADRVIQTTKEEQTKNSPDEFVGASYYQQKEVLNPFMGIASSSDVNKYLRESGTISDEEKYNKRNLAQVLGATNPDTFEKLFHESMKTQNTKKNESEIVGTSMHVGGNIVKPFMGQATDDDVEDLLDSYNTDNNYSDETEEGEMYWE